MREAEQMKFFYIASSLKSKERVGLWIEKLCQQCGLICVLDWTAHIMPDNASTEDRRAWARKEMAAISQTDILIALPQLGRGAHVEIGAALAQGITVIYVGEKDPTCLAYELIEHVSDFDSVVEGIKSGRWDYFGEC